MTKKWKIIQIALGIIFLLSMVLAVVLAPRLRDLNTEYSVVQFMPEKHELLATHEKLHKDFNLDNFSPVLLTIHTEGKSWLEKSRIDKLRKLGDQILAKPEIMELVSIANVESASEEGDDIAMGGLLQLTDPAGWEARIKNDPILYPILISKNFETAVVSIQTGEARTDYLQIVEDIRGKVKDYFPNAEINFGGVPVLQAQMTSLIGEELKLFLFLALCAACLSLILVFKQVVAILIPFFSVILSLILSLEFMVLCNFSFNALSATVGVLVTVIVVAMAIHTELRFYKEYKECRDKKKALEKTFYQLFLPNFLTALTTAVGFITLYTSPAPLIREYGISVAACVLIAWLVTSAFIFSTAALAPLPRPHDWVFGKSKVLSGFIGIRHWVIFAVLVFAGIFLMLGEKISWKAKLFDDLPQNHEARIVTEHIDKNLGGVVPVQFSIISEEEGFWNEPKNLIKIDQLAKKWRKMESVSSVISVPDVIRQSKNSVGGGLPKTRKEIAEVNFMFSLAEKNIMENYLTADGYSLRLAVRMQDIPADKLHETTDKMSVMINQEFPSLKLEKGGLGIYAHKLSEYLSKTLMVGFWWALLAISFVLMFIFRSVSWMLLAALPNFLPAIALLGLLGITGIPVKPAIATIFSIALGIAFDNTVYILSRIRSYGEKKITPELVSRTIQEEGISCMISSFCLFCGFLIFLMSYFSLNQYFGLFLLFSIAVGLIGDLLFLPAVLASLSDFRKKKV